MSVQTPQLRQAGSVASVGALFKCLSLPRLSFRRSSFSLNADFRIIACLRPSPALPRLVAAASRSCPAMRCFYKCLPLIHRLLSRKCASSHCAAERMLSSLSVVQQRWASRAVAAAAVVMHSIPRSHTAFFRQSHYTHRHRHCSLTYNSHSKALLYTVAENWLLSFAPLICFACL